MGREFKVYWLFISGLLLVALLSACGGSDGGTTTPPSSATGTVTGKISNNSTGAVVSGATVTIGALTAVTAVDGTYTVASVPVGAELPVNVTNSGFAAASKIANVTSGATTRADISLLPVASTQTVTSTAAWTSAAISGSAAQVTLGANALKTASGAAPSGAVTAKITPIDPTSNPQIMPGNFTTATGTNIQSYGALDVTFNDATGATLNLASGQTSTIRIPVAAGSTPPATMDAYYYNAATGKWVNEGTLTLAGTAPNQYYTGTVSHFSTWNADKVYDTACLNGKVVDSTGTAVARARVVAVGQGYSGTSETYSAADGTYSIKVKANASVILTAKTSSATSQSVVVSTSAASTVCTTLSTTQNLVIGGTSTSGSAKITLSWGTNPSDLDSHLTGPDGVTSTSRFHVYFSSKGSLTASPFAALDVDDTTSFGPEITTITQFKPGTYRYSVHHFSGSGTIVTSPAFVELILNGETRIFTPPATATVLGSSSVWQVFELVVSSGGTVTVNTLGTYLTGTSASAVPKQAAGFDEYYLFSNLPKK